MAKAYLVSPTCEIKIVGFFLYQTVVNQNQSGALKAPRLVVLILLSQP